MTQIDLQAAQIQLDCRPIEDEDLSEIGTSIDLAFGHYQNAPDNLIRKTLWRETFVTIASKSHPRIVGDLSLAQYLSERHVVISPSGQGRAMVDKQLRTQGKKRQVSLYTSSFTTPVFAVANSELLATVPKQLTVGHEPMLQIFSPPFDMPAFDYHMLWSQLSQHDPANQWLRKLVESSCTNF